MNRRARRAASAKSAPAAKRLAVEKLLEEGVAHHQTGRLDEAERCYRAALHGPSDISNRQGQTDAMHLLGLVQMQRGRLDDARDLISEAVRRNPAHPIYLSNLEIVHLERGEPAEAIARLRQALKIDPDYLDAHYNLGNAFSQSGAMDQALERFVFVAERNPADALSRNNAAVCLIRMEKWEPAIEHLMAALKADPSFADAHANLAMAQLTLGRTGEAETHARRALELAPKHAAALVCLGNIHSARDELEPAADCFRRAAAADASYLAAFTNLGNALSGLHRHEDALAAFRRAAELAPDPADALSGCGRESKALGRMDEAAAFYDAALARDPDHLDARFGRAVTRLMLGNFRDGWSDYLHRESMQGAPDTYLRDRIAADLSGRRCLVERDQGLGDEIFFLRFVPALKTRGAKVGYRPDSRLSDMLERAGIADEILGEDAAVADWDFRIAVGDLPHVLDAGGEPPASIALTPLPDRVRATAETLRAFGLAPYIGLTWWAGTSGINRNLFKNAPLGRFADATRPLPGTVVALQRSPEVGEIDQLAEALGRPVLDLTAANADLEEMLALIGLLDEYVAVSNTYVHLRAAVGRGSRVLVPNPPEFRWMHHGSESPWFPGSVIYRQKVGGDWADAFDRLRADLIDIHGSR